MKERDELRAWVEMHALSRHEIEHGSRLIAKYVAACVRADRTTRPAKESGSPITEFLDDLFELLDVK